MGEHSVSPTLDPEQLRTFTKALLDDLRTMECMLAEGAFETGIRRIGAEQEMFLVDRGMDPAPVAEELLARAHEPRLTQELARFNLEANLTPQRLRGSCFSEMHRELDELIGVADRAARDLGARVLLTGTLPTLRSEHLGLDYMTPSSRYAALNEAISKMRAGAFRIAIEGEDSLEVFHDNVMLEACNTSFQVHLQVEPDEFAHTYNVAQAVTAPVLATACNSPVLLGRRLWHETRVALFPQAVDTRSTAHQARGNLTRVSFGDSWLRHTVLELFREDVARFHVIVAPGALEQLDEGRDRHMLRAFALHNGTVYRWNRPCYGVTDGKPHLRIENRVLPAGPSTLDEMASAALLVGLMVAGPKVWPNLEEDLRFEDAKRNFFAAARDGLDAQIRWLDGKAHPASKLVLEVLLPVAREGLAEAGIDDHDIDRYLDVVRARTEAGRTGASWTLSCLDGLRDVRAPGARHRAVVAAMLARQAEGTSIVDWPLDCATLPHAAWKSDYQTVAQFMTTGLFTVRPQDLIDLAASLMEWEHIRHVPVEDDNGQLVGIVTHRALMGLIARGNREPVPIEQIMTKNPVTVPPSKKTIDAMRLMQDRDLSCLLVTEEGRLVGIVTERDILGVATTLMKDAFDDDE